MIIYKDIISGDEIVSDVYKIKDVGDGLWEVDLSMISKGGEDFQLEGANPSAEGEDVDEGGETTVEKVIDMVHSFQLNDVSKPDKKLYMADLKKYMKKVTEALKAKGESAENIKAFQTGAQNAVKKISKNYDNYDMFVGSSMTEDSMAVLIDYREDGITPYATIWKWGLIEEKV